MRHVYIHKAADNNDEIEYVPWITEIILRGDKQRKKQQKKRFTATFYLVHDPRA